MRAGGGKAKGSAFEREVGAALSSWISHGARRDLFSRNVLSGGRFTRLSKTVDPQSIPGDIIPADPEAFAFSSVFAVECKHVAASEVESYFFRGRRACFIGRVMEKAELQADKSGRFSLTVVRQNFRPTFIFTSETVGKLLIAHSPKSRALAWHSMHSGKVFVTPLAGIMENVDPDGLIAAARKYWSAA